MKIERREQSEIKEEKSTGKKREELKMTAKIVDHADAIKYNEKDEGRTYGRNKPVSLSLIV